MQQRKTIEHEKPIDGFPINPNLLQSLINNKNATLKLW